MSVELYTGAKMPIHGLGTWKSPPGAVGAAVEFALSNGYNHVDCAMLYSNESEIGVALKKAIGKDIQRSDLWVTSKLWNTFHNPEHVQQALRTTLNNLGLDYLDLYLIHWPHSFKFQGFDAANFFPKNEEGTLIAGDVDYVDTWKALEKLVDLGLTKHIGLSNFNSQQIQRIIDNARIKPAVLQVELHPYLNQEKLVNFAKERGLAVTAYAPLGSPDRPWAAGGDPSLLDDPLVKKIAEKYNKTVAQLLIRFPIERGISVIPKSVTPSRIIENRNVFDFKISDEDIASLMSLNQNYRYCALIRDKNMPHWPFGIEF